MGDGVASFSVEQTKDYFAILELNEIIFPEDELEISDKCTYWIARDRDSGEPVGFCGVSNYGSKILFFSRGGILPEYRGRNLFKRFIQVRESFAKRKGFKRIITYTLKDNYPVMSSLIKRGFEIYQPEYDYAGIKFIYLRKILL